MKRCLSVLLLTLVVVATANSQTFRGAINGTITDPSGAAVPNATVKAIESATSIEHTTLLSEHRWALRVPETGTEAASCLESLFPPRSCK